MAVRHVDSFRWILPSWQPRDGCLAGCSSQSKPRSSKQDIRPHHAAGRRAPCTARRPSAIYTAQPFVIVLGRTSDWKACRSSSRISMPTNAEPVCLAQDIYSSRNCGSDTTKSLPEVSTGPRTRCRLAEPTRLVSATRQATIAALAHWSNG
jgi:hypothetical protein